ncbi:hypothetical protein GCM10025865_28940 [Paraoerskovia sediminicola]|uniref:DUF3090 domain-containing protein n=1 Tax=Paraoerskovia sediminicola TaxID=1138587 RepID=A0ABM8G608_9CELL|nr:hypothetical protein GCM10025865_28940 [Paraoerskovia sediminicola]
MPVELIDDEPLEQPVEPEFRAGAMRLSWDPRTAQVVVEAYPVVEDDGEEDPDDEDEPAEVLRVRMPVGSALAFAQRASDVVRSGRPICPLCDRPIDDDGHECLLSDDA